MERRPRYLLELQIRSGGRGRCMQNESCAHLHRSDGAHRPPNTAHGCSRAYRDPAPTEHLYSSSQDRHRYMIYIDQDCENIDLLAFSRLTSPAMIPQRIHDSEYRELWRQVCLLGHPCNRLGVRDECLVLAGLYAPADPSALLARTCIADRTAARTHLVSMEVCRCLGGSSVAFPIWVAARLLKRRCCKPAQAARRARPHPTVRSRCVRPSPPGGRQEKA